MTGGKRAFINFTGNLLINEIPLLLPKEIVVVEILETVDPTPEVVEACRKGKRLPCLTILCLNRALSRYQDFLKFQ